MSKFVKLGDLAIALTSGREPDRRRKDPHGKNRQRPQPERVRRRHDNPSEYDRADGRDERDEPRSDDREQDIERS